MHGIANPWWLKQLVSKSTAWVRLVSSDGKRKFRWVGKTATDVCTDAIVLSTWVLPKHAARVDGYSMKPFFFMWKSALHLCFKQYTTPSSVTFEIAFHVFKKEMVWCVCLSSILLTFVSWIIFLRTKNHVLQANDSEPNWGVRITKSIQL